MFKRSLLLGIFLSLSTPAFAGANASKMADRALAGGPAGVRVALAHASATHDVALAGALLKHATVAVSGDTGLIRAGCHYNGFSSQHTIAILGINVAWQKITVNGFCWTGSRINWWGGAHANRWDSAPYCWKNTSSADYWNPAPKWRTAEASATLGGNAVFGCVSLQHDRPYVNYANGGGIFRH